MTNTPSEPGSWRKAEGILEGVFKPGEADKALRHARGDYDAEMAELEALRAEVARLRAALAAAPRWVSVTERLPDTQETLTVKLDNGMAGFGFHNNTGWVPFGGGVVTHWLELPPAPEAER